MVPWILAAFILCFVGAIKVYVDRTMQVEYDRNGEYSVDGN